MKSIITVFILTISFAATAAANGDEPKLYLQLDGGTAQFANNVIDGQRVGFDEGWSANARIGSDAGRLGLELEAGLHSAPYTSVNSSPSPVFVLTLGLNILLKIVDLPGFDVYGALGGGILYNEDTPEIVQAHFHAEAGAILGPDGYLQLVPHVRSIAYYGASYPFLEETQYISTARLGLRIPVD